MTSRLLHKLPFAGARGEGSLYAASNDHFSMENRPLVQFLCLLPNAHMKKTLKPFWNQRFFLAPQEGLEPTTLRLTAECSAIELLRHFEWICIHSIGIRRRPTLPGRVQPSTIGAEGLNFCVRYGNRWNPFAIATGNRIKMFSHLDNCTVKKNLYHLVGPFRLRL